MIWGHNYFSLFSIANAVQLCVYSVVKFHQKEARNLYKNILETLYAFQSKVACSKGLCLFSLILYFWLFFLSRIKRQS